MRAQMGKGESPTKGRAAGCTPSHRRERERERERESDLGALHTLCIDLEHVHCDDALAITTACFTFAVIEQLASGGGGSSLRSAFKQAAPYTARDGARERREEGKAVDQLENLQDFEDRCDQDGVEDLLAAS